MTKAAGLSIVAAGYAASGLTGELAGRYENRLLQKYYRGFVESAKSVVSQDIEILQLLSDQKTEKGRVFSTDTAGVYDTLWEIGETFGCGLILDAARIPILTETVEICELLDLDPFAVPAKGTVFILTETPVQLSEDLQSRGFPAAIAGRLSEKKARILQIDDRRRFLAKPEKADERGDEPRKQRGEKGLSARGE